MLMNIIIYINKDELCKNEVKNTVKTFRELNLRNLSLNKEQNNRFLFKFEIFIYTYIDFCLM